MGAQWLDFDDLLEPFGHQLFIKNRNHPNLVNCNRSPAKHVFYHLRPLNLGIESPMKFMFFQDAIQDPIFFLNPCQQTRLLDTLQNLAGAKIASKINKVAQKTTRKYLARICKTHIFPRPVSERLLGTISLEF